MHVCACLCVLASMGGCPSVMCYGVTRVTD